MDGWMEFIFRIYMHVCVYVCIRQCSEMDVLQAGWLVSLFTKLYNTEEEEEGNTFVPPVGLVDQTPFFRGWSKNINYSTKS